MYNQVNISSGHSINCQGASDIINEVAEARKVVDRVFEIIKASGKGCYKYHDTSSDSKINLSNIVNWHNGFKDGVDVSIHFNACNHTDDARGVEVCYYSENNLAAAVALNISKASGLIDRGPKERTGLYFLKHTDKPAILIEVCFVDSVKDVEIYKNNFENICNAIAESLIGPIKKVEPVKVDAPKVDAAAYKAKINADVLNVRIGPGTVYAIVTTVKKDDVYTIVEEKNKWGKLKSGAGWISLDYTKRI